MKTILLLIIYFAFLFTDANSQTIEIANYGVTSNVWNSQGKFVQIKRTGTTTFQTGIMLWRPQNFSKAIKVDAVVFLETNLGKYDISDTLKFTNNDFVGWGSGSSTKMINCSISATLLHYTTTSRLKVKYRFYKNQYPSPDQVDGWTEMLVAPGDHNYSILNVYYEPEIVPPTTISGPTEICTDAIYNITNPGIVSLENSFGVASIIDMGNGQYKMVVNDPSYGRNVDLVSTKNGQITSIKVKVGSGSHLGTIKTFPQIVSKKGTYEVDFVDSGNDFVSISNWSVSSSNNSVSITSNGAKKATLNVNTWNLQGSNIINITITGSTQCGEIHTRTVKVGLDANGGGPSILDPDA